MAKMGPITLLMLKHHGIINGFLGDFEKVSEDDPDELKGTFNIFKWNLEKHVFVEEKNIFTIADKTNKLEMMQLKNLLKDHKDIMVVVDNISEDINDGRKPNVKILRDILFAHEGREIENFYPLLDNRLSAEDKNDLVQRVNDIVLG